MVELAVHTGLRWSEQMGLRWRDCDFLAGTTNLAFSDWPTIFPNAGSAIALIDRLIHHAEILTIEGESYRRRAAELTRKTPRAKASS